MTIKNRKISGNFWLKEFTKSSTAMRQGGKMLEEQQNPPREVVAAIHYHAQKTCQLARDFFGVMINISSGIRMPLLNEFVGGSETSQHCKGEASDQELSESVFEESPEIISLIDAIIMAITDKEPRENLGANFYLFAYYCIFRHECDVDQVIHEYGEDGDPEWVHVSSSANRDRRQILIKRSGQDIIEIGLKEALLLGC